MKSKASDDFHFNALRRFPQLRVSISNQLNHNQQLSKSRKESKTTVESINKMNSFKSSALDELDNHLIHIRNKHKNVYKQIANPIHCLDKDNETKCIASTDFNFHLERLFIQLTNVGFILEHPETDICQCGIREVLELSLYSTYTINELSWQVEVVLGIKLKSEELTILHYLLFNNK